MVPSLHEQADQPLAYRAQVNLLDAEVPHPPVAKVESWRSTSSDWQSGHCKFRSASCIRRNFSKLLPQHWHWYS
jgi:hypothetical protein